MNNVECRAKQETYDNLAVASARLEEFIGQFQGKSGFDWYEGRLQEVLRDMRRSEEIDQWLDSRKRAGRLIDAATAEVYSCHTEVLDPYGISNVPPEFSCVARSHFARSPESDGWVSFSDLPEETVEALWARINAGEFKDDTIAEGD
jgi:hypothetical protein